MRLLIGILLLIPTLAFAKHVTITITPAYPLNPINAQLICNSLHANLSTDALILLDTLSDLPFVCKLTENADKTKQLQIIMTLK